MYFFTILGTISSLFWYNILQSDIAITATSDGILPPTLGIKNKYGSPYILLILNATLAIIFFYIGKISEFIDILNWVFISIGFCCLGVVFLHYSKQPKELPPLKIWGFLFSFLSILLGKLYSLNGYFGTLLFTITILLLIIVTIKFIYECKIIDVSRKKE